MIISNSRFHPWRPSQRQKRSFFGFITFTHSYHSHFYRSHGVEKTKKIKFQSGSLKDESLIKAFFPSEILMDCTFLLLVQNLRQGRSVVSDMRWQLENREDISQAVRACLIGFQIFVNIIIIMYQRIITVNMPRLIWLVLYMMIVIIDYCITCKMIIIIL